MMTERLLAEEKECANGRTAPRVSLTDIEAAIGSVNHINAGEAIMALRQSVMPEHRLLSICLVTMRNGFMVIGKSAPASADNFDADLGRKLAYEDAIRQIWPLMGFALRDRLAAAA